MNQTISGYNYSTGPVLPDPHSRTIPGYRYSFGPILIEEDSRPEAPKIPTRRLTKRPPLPPLPSDPVPVPPKRPLRPDHALLLAPVADSRIPNQDTFTCTRNPRTPSQHSLTSFHGHQELKRCIFAPDTKDSVHASTTPLTPPPYTRTHTSIPSPNIPHHAHKNSLVSSISTAPSTIPSLNTPSSGYTKHTPTSSVSSTSTKHVTMSSISSMASGKMNQYAKETPTLTPLSSAFVRSPSLLSPTDSRFVFSLSPSLKSTPKTRRSSCISQIIDHFAQKRQTKQQEELARSEYLLTLAREKTAISKVPRSSSPIYLTTDERRIVEGYRKEVLEMRLERALSGRKYRVAHRLDGEIKAMEAEEGGWVGERI